MGTIRTDSWWAERLVAWHAWTARAPAPSSRESLLAELLDEALEVAAIIARQRRAYPTADEDVLRDVLLSRSEGDSPDATRLGVLDRVARAAAAGDIRTSVRSYLFRAIQTALTNARKQAARVHLGEDISNRRKQVPPPIHAWADDGNTISVSNGPAVDPAAFVLAVAKGFRDAESVVELLLGIAAGTRAPKAVRLLAEMLSGAVRDSQRGPIAWRQLRGFLHQDALRGSARNPWRHRGIEVKDGWARAWQAAYHDFEGDGWCRRDEIPASADASRSAFDKHTQRFRGAWGAANRAAGGVVKGLATGSAGPDQRADEPRRVLPIDWEPPFHPTLSRRRS